MYDLDAEMEDRVHPWEDSQVEVKVTERNICHLYLP